MRILVTGAYGQLGVDAVRVLSQSGHDVFGFSSKEMDVTNLEIVEQIMTKIKPDVVIHTAAYTKVDQAEKEIEETYRVNTYGTRNVVVATERIGAKFCYISTDYVFDGNTATPYQEYDQTNPISVYGKSKYAGEVLTQSLSSKYFIVRTSWVYGVYGHNFVKTMLRIAREREEIGVVNDQIGSPTYTEDLARFLANLIVTERYGIYHASNRGTCSWYEFALEIFKHARIDIKVNPLNTAQYPTPARRPAYSMLDDIAIRANGLDALPHWKEGLIQFFNRMKEMSDET